MGRLAAFRALWRAVSGHRGPGSPTLAARVRVLPRMVRDTLTGRYPGLDRSRLALMALAAVYVVSPVDLVPEAALALAGVVDDAVVLAWLAGALLSETESYLGWRQERDRAGASTVRGHVVR